MDEPGGSAPGARPDEPVDSDGDSHRVWSLPRAIGALTVLPHVFVWEAQARVELGATAVSGCSRSGASSSGRIPPRMTSTTERRPSASLPGR